jgi:glycosyltransferase involved in cell wall biosynthesis
VNVNQSNRYSESLSGPVASIIIPAHNESAVIGRCLQSIFSAALPAEFEVIVVCNGCSDSTADIVRNDFPFASLIETPKASKTGALNLGDAAASVFPRIYLDADLVVSVESLRLIVQPLVSDDALAACGQMNISFNQSSFPVRSFYRVWSHNSYLKNGKFGGLFAVSRKGHSRVSPFPELTNDDEFVRRSFTGEERAFVENSSFEMIAPRSISGLLKIRSRAIRGTRELSQVGYLDEQPQSRNIVELLAIIIKKPSLWVDTFFYIGISLLVRVKVVVAGKKNNQMWERDESSRKPA